jgi:hypothetical protein
MSVAEARVTAAVSVFEFSTSVLATHDTPDGIVTVHFVEADSVAVAAVSRILESAAAEVPWSAAVKVVVPHPLTEGVIEPIVNDGRAMSIVSPTASPTFNENVKSTAVGAPETGCDSTTLWFKMAGTGVMLPGFVAKTSVDSMIATATMSELSANVAATVRLATFPAWVPEGIVIPDEIVRVHSVSLAKWAVPAVNTTLAVADPELANVPVKVVEPQPDSRTVGVPLRAKDGTVTSMVSDVFTGTLRVNAKDTDDAVLITGDARVSLVFRNAEAGCVTAGEVGIATAPISVDAAKTAATVRELSSAPAA